MSVTRAGGARRRCHDAPTTAAAAAADVRLREPLLRPRVPGAAELLLRPAADRRRPDRRWSSGRGSGSRCRAIATAGASSAAWTSPARRRRPAPAAAIRRRSGRLRESRLRDGLLRQRPGGVRADARRSRRRLPAGGRSVRAAASQARPAPGQADPSRPQPENRRQGMLGAPEGRRLRRRPVAALPRGSRPRTAATLGGRCGDDAGCEYARVLERPCVHAELVDLTPGLPPPDRRPHTLFKAALAERAEVSEAMQGGPAAVRDYLRQHPPARFCFLDDLMCCLVDLEGTTSPTSRTSRTSAQRGCGSGCSTTGCCSSSTATAASCRPDTGVPLAAHLPASIAPTCRRSARVHVHRRERAAPPSAARTSACEGPGSTSSTAPLLLAAARAGESI